MNTLGAKLVLTNTLSKLLCLVFLFHISVDAANKHSEIQNSHEPSKKKAHSAVHATIPLYDIIIHGLNNSSSAESGLLWTKLNQEFAVNMDQFHQFYNSKTHSHCAINSLKNRLTRMKSGFIRHNNVSVPDGFTFLCTHVKWKNGLVIPPLEFKPKKVVNASEKKSSLFAVVMEALNINQPEITGLKWITPQMLFAIDNQKFTTYYNGQNTLNATNSCKWSSIKNRLTKSKSGFEMIQVEANLMPPDGYNALYRHETWDWDISLLKTNMSTGENRISVIENDTNILPANANIIFSSTSTPDNIDISIYQPPPSRKTMFKEIIPATLLGLQPNVWETFAFDVKQFFCDLVNSDLFVEPIDIENLNILLASEDPVGFNTGIMSTYSLSKFGSRFGWAMLVLSVRDFIHSGAKDWYQGPLDKNNAEELLSNCPSNRKIYYLIRASDDKEEVINHKLVFSISYRDLQGQIIHEPIFKDQFEHFSMIDENNEAIIFASFKQIIAMVVGDNAVPVGNSIFAGLQIVQEKKSVIYKCDDINFKKRKLNHS